MLEGLRRPVFALVLPALLAACNAVNTYATTQPPSNVDLRRVERDPLLAADVKVVSARIDARGTGKLAQVTVRNDGTGTRTVEAAFDWFDQDGVSVGGRREWERLELQPGQSREIQQAGSRDATDFRMTLRPAKG